MSCGRPLRATRNRVTRVVRIGRYSWGDPIELPCGKCTLCLFERSRMWSVRINHEAALYESNLFLTLDYAPEYLESWDLIYGHFQGFMERMRKARELVESPIVVGPGPNGKFPIRYFVAGEYGARYQRPHFHAIVFNVAFKDKEVWRNGMFRSTSLEEMWGYGCVRGGTVTPQSAAYVAGYTLGKLKLREQNELVDRTTGEISYRRPEMVHMSLKPGLGYWWYERYKRDVFPRDRVVSAGGAETKVPRYYSKLYEKEADGKDLAALEELRGNRGNSIPSEEKTERRRLTRLAVAEGKTALFRSQDH